MQQSPKQFTPEKIAERMYKDKMFREAVVHGINLYTELYVFPGIKKKELSS